MNTKKVDISLQKLALKLGLEARALLLSKQICGGECLRESLQKKKWRLSVIHLVCCGSVQDHRGQLIPNAKI